MAETESGANNNDVIDLKLLLFRENAVDNQTEAIEIIKSELQTCLFIERFEYFQKLIILNLWLCASTGKSVDSVRELIQMHAPNVKSTDHINNSDTT